MPTNIDKALYQMPDGMDDMSEGPDDGQEAFEIEIVDPEAVTIHAGGKSIALMPGEEDGEDFSANLAEEIDDGVLATLASDLEADISDDCNSRKDWEDGIITGMKLLGLKYEERAEPWLGACGVFHPMIAEAVIRFQSEMITETFPAAGPAKTKIIGKETQAKKEAAVRVEDEMNYQLTEKMPEFRPEHERLLWNLAGSGAAFKKVYFDPSLGRQVSMFIPAEDVLLPYGVPDARSSHRVTHVMRKNKNEILKLQASGFYRDVDIGEPENTKDDIQKAKDEETGFNDINDDRFVLYESCMDLDLPGYEDEEDGEPTGIALPYIVTMLRGTDMVLSIRRNWKEDDKYKLRRQHFVQYTYIPGYGPYGLGLFHLIGGYAKGATSILRQLVDAGTLSNLPGGLKARGLRIKGDDTPIAPGEWRDVDIGAGTMRDNMMPLPYKEPSGTLFQLFTTIVDEGRRFASTADMDVSDMSSQAPVGTTLALLERQLKVMSAIQARTHYSLKQELNLLKDIIRDYTDEDYNYEPDVGRASARKEDFQHVDIIPVSDPNAATLSQRVVQYQAVIQLAQSAPDIYDLPQLHRGMLEVLGIKNADKLVPLPDDLKPTDPVSENQGILKGSPVKAFLHQDHESHIKVHMAASQDPVIMQLMGQNPKAQQIMGAMMAHVADHVGFAYRQKIEQQLGMALPSEETKLSPEVEIALSNMMAQAAQQVLQRSKQQAAQQQAQQQAQDPLFKLQQQELQLKQQELQMKQQDMQVKQQDSQHRLQMEAQKAQQAAQQQNQQMQADAAMQQANLQQQNQRVQAEAAKQQMDAQRASAEIQQMQAELQLEREKLQLEKHLEQQRIAIEAAKVQADQKNEMLRTGTGLYNEVMNRQTDSQHRTHDRVAQQFTGHAQRQHDTEKMKLQERFRQKQPKNDKKGDKTP